MRSFFSFHPTAATPTPASYSEPAGHPRFLWIFFFFLECEDEDTGGQTHPQLEHADWRKQTGDGRKNKQKMRGHEGNKPPGFVMKYNICTNCYPMSAVSQTVEGSSRRVSGSEPGRKHPWTHVPHNATEGWLLFEINWVRWKLQCHYYQDGLALKTFDVLGRFSKSKSIVRLLIKLSQGRTLKAFQRRLPSLSQARRISISCLVLRTRMKSCRNFISDQSSNLKLGNSLKNFLPLSGRLVGIIPYFKESIDRSFNRLISIKK